MFFNFLCTLYNLHNCTIYILRVNIYVLELNAQTFLLKGMRVPKSLDVSGLEQYLPKNINVP